METPKNWRHPDGTPMTCLEDCDKPVEVAGRCQAHYHASRRVPGRSKNQGWYDDNGNRMPCQDPGCSSEVEARGLCSSHYRASLKVEPKDKRRPRNKWVNPDGTRKSCHEEGCERPVHASGLCSLHYDRVWKVSSIVNSEWGICPISECERKKRAGALICGRCRQTRWRYGLTDEVYLEMMRVENRFCSNPGCGSTERLHLDHDHSCCPYGKFPTKTRSSCGECVRGWLCHSCNTSLGQMQESPERIRGLLTYLEQTRR